MSSSDKQESRLDKQKMRELITLWVTAPHKLDEATAADVARRIERDARWSELYASVVAELPAPDVSRRLPHDEDAARAVARAILAGRDPLDALNWEQQPRLPADALKTPAPQRLDTSASSKPAALDTEQGRAATRDAVERVLADGA